MKEQKAKLLQMKYASLHVNWERVLMLTRFGFNVDPAHLK